MRRKPSHLPDPPLFAETDDSATAGGIFTFPLIAESPDISRFRLTQPQLSTIVLA